MVQVFDWGSGFGERGMGLRMWGTPVCENLALRFQGVGLRVYSLGSRVYGLGFRVYGLGFEVYGLGFRA